MKKFFILLLLVSIFFITGCKKEEITVINEVVNRDVKIGDVEQINNLEDQLSVASSMAVQSCVGVTAKSSTSLVGGNDASGVIIKKDNNDYYIVTNYHVIGSKGNTYDQINIYLGNIDVTLSASIVSFNADNDLALLKITTEINLQPATIFNGETKLASFCIAVGCPYDMKLYYNSVTIGNISALDRNLEEVSLKDEKTAVTNKYLQHNADINVGNSGGGLFNLKGELIGINTSKLTKTLETIEGMSLAIPVEVVKATFSEYLN